MKSACNGNETACGERLLISDIDGSEEEKYPEEKNRFRIKAKNNLEEYGQFKIRSKGEQIKIKNKIKFYLKNI